MKMKRCISFHVDGTTIFILNYPKTFYLIQSGLTDEKTYIQKAGIKRLQIILGRKGMACKDSNLFPVGSVFSSL